MKLQIDLNNFKFDTIHNLQDFQKGYYLRKSIHTGDVKLIEVTECKEDIVWYATFHDLDPECLEYDRIPFTKNDLAFNNHKFARIGIIPQPDLVKQLPIRKPNQLVKITQEVHNVVKQVDMEVVLHFRNPVVAQDFNEIVVDKGVSLKFEQLVHQTTDYAYVEELMNLFDKLILTRPANVVSLKVPKILVGVFKKILVNYFDLLNKENV